MSTDLSSSRQALRRAQIWQLLRGPQQSNFGITQEFRIAQDAIVEHRITDPMGATVSHVEPQSTYEHCVTVTKYNHFTKATVLTATVESPPAIDFGGGAAYYQRDLYWNGQSQSAPWRQPFTVATTFKNQSLNYREHTLEVTVTLHSALPAQGGRSVMIIPSAPNGAQPLPQTISSPTSPPAKGHTP